MATKTISLREEAYERLRRAKRGPAESFSDVVMRAVWLDQPTTAGEFLRAARERGPMCAGKHREFRRELTGPLPRPSCGKVDVCVVRIPLIRNN